VEGRARTLCLGRGKKPGQDSGTHLGSREDGDNRAIKLEGARASTRMRHGRRRYPSKIGSRRNVVKKMIERQERERQDGSLGANETLFPEGGSRDT